MRSVGRNETDFQATEEQVREFANKADGEV